jgi:hypothetical protein
MSKIKDLDKMDDDELLRKIREARHLLNSTPELDFFRRDLIQDSLDELEAEQSRRTFRRDPTGPQ